MRILSIDPGISGGLALLEFTLPSPTSDPRVLEVLDMPIMARKKDGTGNAVNYAVLCLELDRLQPTLVVIEKVSGMGGRSHGQKMGASGLFNFGMGFGVIVGCCARIPMIFTTPAAWKKRLGIPGAKEGTSDYARTYTLQLFPYLGEQLKRKKDLGRAEAILIGVDYCRQLRGDHGELAGVPFTSIVPSGYTRELGL